MTKPIDLKKKRKEKLKKTISDFLKSIEICETIQELEDALKKIEVRIEKIRAANQQLLFFKAQTQQRLKVLKKEPGQ